MLRVLLIALISLSSIACTSVPEPKELPNIWENLKKTEYADVKPIEVPNKPTSYVVVGSDGKEYASFDPQDLQALKKAFAAAESNSDLVVKLNSLNQLLVQKLNLMEELVALEEYKSARLENELAKADYNAEKQQTAAKIEKTSWQIVSILALLVGL